MFLVAYKNINSVTEGHSWSKFEFFEIQKSWLDSIDSLCSKLRILGYLFGNVKIFHYKANVINRSRE